MAAPIIDTTTSVLGWRLGEAWAYQPAITNLPEPTGWTWSNLPPGVTANATTGLIEGPGTEPGVYLARVIATNGDGDSDPLVVPIAIFERLWADDGATPINIDIRTGRVCPAWTTDWAPGDPVLFAKSGDHLLLDVGFTADGGDSLIDLGPSAITLGLKEYEPENLLDLSDGGFETIGEWDRTRYRILCHLEASKLEAALGNYEEDAETAFSALCEIEWQQPISWDGGALTLTRSSQTFLLRLSREIIAP